MTPHSPNVSTKPQRNVSNCSSIIHNGSSRGALTTDGSSPASKLLRVSAKRSHSPTSPLQRRTLAHSVSTLLSGASAVAATAPAVSLRGAPRSPAPSAVVEASNFSPLDPRSRHLPAQVHSPLPREHPNFENCVPDEGEEGEDVAEPEDVEAPYTPLRMPSLILATFVASN